MANQLHKYINNYDDFQYALKMHLGGLPILLEKKKNDAILLNANNNELLLDYYVKERKKLLDKIKLSDFLMKVEIKNFGFTIDKQDFENQLEFIKEFNFKKVDAIYVIEKEEVKHLRHFFNCINNSVWIAFYNSQIEELKGGKKENETNDFYPFKDAEKYNIFLEYVKLHIIEPYLDFSYLYQRLLEKEFIKYIKQKVFMKWLFDNDFINEKTFNSFNVKGQFYSLKKATTPQRENNFNNLFKL